MACFSVGYSEQNLLTGKDWGPWARCPCKSFFDASEKEEDEVGNRTWSGESRIQDWCDWRDVWWQCQAASVDKRAWERGGGCHGAATTFALGPRLAIVATTEGGRDGEYSWRRGDLVMIQYNI